jgi:hypothetical protein
VGNGRRTAAAHGEQGVAGVEERGGGGARCSGCARQREKERNGKGLNRRSSRQPRRSEWREVVPAFATAAARCRSAGAQAGEEKGVASVREGQGGEARAALELGATRGGEAQQKSRGEAPEEEEREKGVRGTGLQK